MGVRNNKLSEKDIFLHRSYLPLKPVIECLTFTRAQTSPIIITAKYATILSIKQAQQRNCISLPFDEAKSGMISFNLATHGLMNDKCLSDNVHFQQHFLQASGWPFEIIPLVKYGTVV